MKPLDKSSSKPACSPHDLLWLASRKALLSNEALPDWAASGRLAHAPVVVRREMLGDSALIPVGLRGETRSQRLGAYVHHDAVLRVVRPETLATSAAWKTRLTLRHFAAVAALEDLAPCLDSTGLCWGPTGSTGFALATGLAVLRVDSDLDLLVRAPAPLTPAQVAVLRAVLGSSPCRVDMQIDIGRAAFYFAEWASGPRHVLLKTDTGPLLTGDPWKVDAPIAGEPFQ
jgi:phosphoribosyl-dephospho-CoA transferase